MGLTDEEQEFILKLQQPTVDEDYSEIQYSFEDKLLLIKSSVEEAKSQLLTVQGHLNSLEDASKSLKEKYLLHQHTFIELNNVLNWFDVIDELIVILRSGIPVEQAVNLNFDKMYKEVDQCYEYLLQHPDYKLSIEYLPTARIVITKALSLYSHAFNDVLDKVPFEIRGIASAQSNFDSFINQLKLYTTPLSDKQSDVEFRQILEDCIEAFSQHRNQSIRNFFINTSFDQESPVGCVTSFIQLIKSFLLKESILYEKIFKFNYISYNQMYSNLIQIGTKHVVEYIASSDPDLLLEIRLILNNELIASELDSKSKLVLLQGTGDLSNFLNKS
eukprot:NODE_698_length_5079_cov_0.796586.p2 type:complete len:331 gc:universal NODE_698_length_5079_cov_0.796586:1283-291(-)